MADLGPPMTMSCWPVSIGHSLFSDVFNCFQSFGFSSPGKSYESSQGFIVSEFYSRKGQACVVDLQPSEVCLEQPQGHANSTHHTATATACDSAFFCQRRLLLVFSMMRI